MSKDFKQNDKKRYRKMNNDAVRTSVKMNNSKEWYIGIDFGTSNTYIAAYEAKSKKLFTGSFKKDIEDTSQNIPTGIVLDVVKSEKGHDEKSYYIGAEIEAHPILHPFKELKMAAREIMPKNGTFGRGAVTFPFENCGIDSNVELGREDYSVPVEVKDLEKQFFKRVLCIDDKNFEVNKDTVQQIVIGQPVRNDEIYEGVLKDLLAESFTDDETEQKFFKDKIQVVAEPELAGITYFYSERERENKTVLVIDIGGGTTDFSIMAYDSNGEVKVANIASCEIAGNAIDKMIYELLPKSLNVRSMVKCRNWKQTLFAEDKNDYKIYPKSVDELRDPMCMVDIGQEIGVKGCYIYYKSSNLSGNSISIEDSITEKIYKEIEDALNKALDKWKNENNEKKINTIFFVGGTSIITPLREGLEQIVKDKFHGIPIETVTMFEDNQKSIKADGGPTFYVTCYNAVAIGACLKAMNDRISLRHKPKLSIACKDFEEELVFNTTENDLIMTMANYKLPFACARLKGVESIRKRRKHWADRFHTDIAPIIIPIKINNVEDRTLIISTKELEGIDNIFIVASMADYNVEFQAYASNNQNMTLQEVVKCSQISCDEKL